MKKMYLLLIITTSILLTGTIPNETEPAAIQTLAEFAETNELPIRGWEVTMKETLYVSNYDEILNNLGNRYRIAGKENENRLQYDFMDNKKMKHIEWEQRMIIAKENTGQVELTAVISGQAWNESIAAEYNELIAHLNRNFFQNNATTFTWIEVVKDGTIVDTVTIDKLAESLQLLHMEEQLDTVENSKLKMMYYGYTPLWDDKFVVEGIPYNFQIAATPLETDEIAYMIGTPILMNEY